MSDLETSVKLVLDAGLSTGHADSYSDLVDELLSQAVELRDERNGLLRLTRLITEHPEGYNGPCECDLCEGYANEDGETLRHDR